MIGTCRAVGVTHLALWTANYLNGVCREKTAVLEWSSHKDLERLGRFCEEKDRKRRDGTAAAAKKYRILEVDYFTEAGAAELADCLAGDYRHILVDYGEIQGQNILECARCDRKVIVGSLSEWQAETFLEAVKVSRKKDKSWKYAAAFGSEEARRETEKQFRIQVQRIPFSRDVFAVTRADMRFFSEFLR